MVSRENASGTHARIVGGTFGWYLIGLVVGALFIFLAGGQAIFSVLTQPTGFRSPTVLLAMIEHIVIVVGIGCAAGCVISSLGVMTSMLKYSAELHADEIRATEDMLDLQPIGPSKVNVASNVKVCASCGSENDVSRADCDHRGSRLGN
jgi:hypothetical protein